MSSIVSLDLALARALLRAIGDFIEHVDRVAVEHERRAVLAATRRCGDRTRGLMSAIGRTFDAAL